LAARPVISNRYARGVAKGFFVDKCTISIDKNDRKKRLARRGKGRKGVYFTSHWEGGYTGQGIKKFFTGKRDEGIKE
jgi:hypothetical protein